MHIHAFTRTTETPVTLFGIEVLFKPNASGHVVAEVTDERAAERLLSIKEAYRPYHASTPVAAAVAAVAAPAPVQAPAPGPVATPAEPEADPEPESPKGHSAAGFPSTFEIAEGKTVTIAEIVAAAQARSGLDVEEWNLNDEEDRDTLIEAEIDLQVQAAAAATAQPPAGDTPPTSSAPAVSLVLTAEGGETVDLGAMTAKDVRAFAAQNGVELPTGNSTKVGDLRLMVVQALTKA